MLDLNALRAPRTRAPGPALPHVSDLTGPGGLRLRHYRPADEPRPLMVFLHGGAFILGDLDSHDRTCRRIAAACGVEVLAVDYRLAPEHPYPAAIDDAVEVLRWAKPWAVAGDSAGGYLATMACLRLRDAGEPLPAAQVLICPNTDLTLASASVREQGGWGLDPAFLREAISYWTPDPADPAASPLSTPGLHDLPSAVVITAERDPLRDEGEAYAERLREAGVEVMGRREEGLEHGFIQNLDEAAVAASERIFRDIQRLLP
ncbi:alpha/beta hydrolase [Nonomuraea sp. NPDC050328]|uniref:alpha/beta hydrolase n=2 Tax=unclassified Nonomuraea TaxID=2593643 RepID=UPI0037BCEB2F